MARTLSQVKSAQHCGMGVRLFRDICRRGEGPRVFNPHGGRPRYVDTVLDEWMASRDDGQPSQHTASAA